MREASSGARCASLATDCKATERYRAPDLSLSMVRTALFRWLTLMTGTPGRAVPACTSGAFFALMMHRCCKLVEGFDSSPPCARAAWRTSDLPCAQSAVAGPQNAACDTTLHSLPQHDLKSCPIRIRVCGALHRARGQRCLTVSMSFKYAELFTRDAGSHESDSALDEAVLRASASTSTRTQAFFAHQGSIHIYDDRMRRVHTFPTFPEVKHLAAVRHGKLLLVLGSANANELVSSTCIGFWCPDPSSAAEWKSLYEFQPFKSAHAPEAAVTAWTVRDLGDRVAVVLALHFAPPVVVQLEFRVSPTAHGGGLKVSRLKGGRRLSIDPAAEPLRDGRVTNLCIAGDAGAAQVRVRTCGGRSCSRDHIFADASLSLPRKFREFPITLPGKYSISVRKNDP